MKFKYEWIRYTQDPTLDEGGAVRIIGDVDKATQYGGKCCDIR